MSNPEFFKEIENKIGEAKRKEALSNAKLQFKALIFLNKKICRSCRHKILLRVRQGQVFKVDLLCKDCKVIYNKEVTQ
jgi:hypothetical protein